MAWASFYWVQSAIQDSISHISLMLESAALPHLPIGTGGKDTRLYTMHALPLTSSCSFPIRLQAGADVNLPTRNGNTALRAAVLLGDAEIVQFLTEQARSHIIMGLPSMAPDDGAASEKGSRGQCNPDMLGVCMCLQGADVDLETGRGTALLTACSQGDADMAALLLDKVFMMSCSAWFLCQQVLPCPAAAEIA